MTGMGVAAESNGLATRPHNCWSVSMARLVAGTSSDTNDHQDDEPDY